ncbi:hypothetical protein BVRB_6g144850 [Beta vulgaris subsp. vulgaris]|nr:hypothetical protein BVRB_6g144850 [Beta vulgaris subsp. vulgaris]
MGQPTLNKAKAAISSYQLLMQFETDDGKVGKIQGDQQTTRECYLCILVGESSVNAKSDSQLTVGQVLGENEAKEDNMRTYLAKTKDVINKLSNFWISRIPRSENQQADALARMASLAEGLTPRTITWEVLKEPSINAKEQLVLDRASQWMDDVVRYLRDELLPDDPKEVVRIKHKSDCFLWNKNQLYKSFTHPPQVCYSRRR